MLSLEDPRWQQYRGGYNAVVVDLLPFLRKLKSGEVRTADWDVLWEDLHHQGDVGEASYAVVPFLVEFARNASVIPWHVFGFAAVVELERTENNNPAVPVEIEESYFESVQELPKLALSRGISCWGENCFEPVMSCLALSLGRRAHARIYLDLTESEIPEFEKYYHG